MSAGAVDVIPTLFVDDLEKARDFYGRLGFRHDWSFPEETPATHLGLCFGTVTVMLALEPRCGDLPGRQNLYFVLRDLDEYHRRLERGLDTEVPAIVRADYGMRDFSICDPWGHLLTFGEASEGAKAGRAEAGGAG